MLSVSEPALQNQSGCVISMVELFTDGLQTEKIQFYIAVWRALGYTQSCSLAVWLEVLVRTVLQDHQGYCPFQSTSEMLSSLVCCQSTFQHLILNFPVLILVFISYSPGDACYWNYMIHRAKCVPRATLKTLLD